jgi:hypothetical protein
MYHFFLSNTQADKIDHQSNLAVKNTTREMTLTFPIHFFVHLHPIKSALDFTSQKTDLSGGEERANLLPPPLPFSFLHPALTIPLSFWFFLLFVGVLRPNQQFWPIRFASIHLPPCCAVHLLPDRCCCFLVMFLV